MTKIFAVVTLISISAALTFSTASLAKSAEQVHQINVSGQANVASVPDLFEFSVYVEEQGEKVQNLNRVVTDKTQTIVSSVLAFGVDKKDIQSMRVQLNPWYENINNQRVQNGFRLSREIKFTLRDIELYDQVIDAVLSTGVSRIDGFNYVVEDAQPQYLAALELALKDAKLRASRMAATLGATLGKVISISENSGYSPMPRAREVMMMSKSSDSLPGQINTGAQVNVVFELVE
ncbi:SIMPL domain-containing protein [uncultured Paraglaciecola sp.]|uniref:SIMPL domain-containing protein n=1 Tax=uncultured Paraglaciecola sp. TaxID=1765024 RepID=UPI0030DA651F|tara:strand:- start:7391 stop:8092 length:702 start_codon:yes stop_codon:yes gene_type:complete